MSSPNGSDDASELAESRGFQPPLQATYRYFNADDPGDPELPWHLKPRRTSLMPSVAEAKARITEIREELGDLMAYVKRKEKRAHKAEVMREKAGN